MLVPKLETEAVCITNNFELGVLISSLFNNTSAYFPIFRFPDVNAFYSEEDDSNSDGYLSRIIGKETKVLINNAFARLKPRHIILAGLNEMQKSFFAFLPEELVITVDSIDNLEDRLMLLRRSFNGEIRCNRDDLLVGLIHARSANKKLIYDENSKSISGTVNIKDDGLIVIENSNDVSSLIAVNYAFSINAEIVLVDPLEEEEIQSIQKSIHKWKKTGACNAYNKIKKKVSSRVEGIDFSKYKYATFFTEGLPYSLILKNIIPMTYVRKSLREDFFIFNNIFYEQVDQFNSALIFSPKEFSDEETQELIEKLRTNDFFVKDLVYDNATVRNFGNYTEHYPFDLLHICSHGGETDGYYVIEQFKDRDGKQHKVEYEEVVGFSLVPGTEKVTIHRKAIFRKFDGFRWMSPEMKQQNFPEYVFEDMRRAIFNVDTGKKAFRVKANYNIFNSCHVKCYDSIHQGEFNVIASHSSPIVFNNTCSSWYEIIGHFIAAGCRGYIGTLWPIDNSIAKNSSLHFYDNFLSKGILGAFFEMCQQTHNTQDSDIYIYWGLHFSTIQKPQKTGRAKVLNELSRSFSAYKRKYNKTKIPEVKKNSAYILKFIYEEIAGNFGREDVQDLEKEILKQDPEFFEKKDSNSDEENIRGFQERSTMDLPGLIDRSQPFLHK